MAASGLCAGAMAQQASPPCGGAAVGRGTVNRVIDGRTVVLDGGREVRLAAIEVPALPQTPGDGAAGAMAKSTLEALAGDDEIELRGAEIATDRYGRTVAYVYTIRDGDEFFVQGELVAAGAARVGLRIGSRSCATSLMNREAEARTARLGLWADPRYAVLDAGATATVLAQRGRFALVEGPVISVRESGSTIYVNFARHWSEGFSVTVPKRSQRGFAAAGLDLNALTGRRVRVRGFVEARGLAESSPSIAAERPEQIEVLSGD